MIRMNKATEVMKSAQHWLNLIRALPLTRPVRIMNVCGGHERAITMAGLRSALPKNVELIPGPGCPVCVCPEEDVYHAMQLAMHAGVILAAFGDMLRVPVNVPKKKRARWNRPRAPIYDRVFRASSCSCFQGSDPALRRWRMPAIVLSK
jgi:hydrogenase expression/formation protein HypD